MMDILRRDTSLYSGLKRTISWLDEVQKDATIFIDMAENRDKRNSRGSEYEGLRDEIREAVNDFKAKLQPLATKVLELEARELDESAQEFAEQARAFARVVRGATIA